MRAKAAKIVRVRCELSTADFFDHLVFCIVDSCGSFLIKFDLLLSRPLDRIGMESLDGILIGAHHLCFTRILGNPEDFMRLTGQADSRQGEGRLPGGLRFRWAELGLGGIRTLSEDPIEIGPIRLAVLEFGGLFPASRKKHNRKQRKQKDSGLDPLEVFGDELEHVHGFSIEGALCASKVQPRWMTL
jgi:hypothetical protein